MSDYPDYPDLVFPFKILLVALGIVLLFIGSILVYHSINGEKLTCEKSYETVCYKAVGGFGNDYLEIDCNSNNVDRTRKEVKRETCIWVEKDAQAVEGEGQ